MFSFLIAVLITCINAGQTTLDTNCVSQKSPESLFRTKGNRMVSCPVGPEKWVMTGCGYQGPWQGGDALYIDYTDPDVPECTANLNGGYAVAQCCDIGEYAQCQTVDVQSDGRSATATCPATHTIVGCVTMGEATIANNECTGYRRINDALDVRVQAICCEIDVPLDTISMECTESMGTVSGTADDVQSQTVCPSSDSFLTSCNEQVDVTNAHQHWLDGHFTVDGDTCSAQSSGHNALGTTASATCCSLTVECDDFKSSPCDIYRPEEQCNFQCVLGCAFGCGSECNGAADNEQCLAECKPRCEGDCTSNCMEFQTFCPPIYQKCVDAGFVYI